MLRHNWRLTSSVGILLGAVTLALFWPVSNYDFIVFDDGQYVFENSHVATGLTWANVVWAVTHFHSGNWHPLTWISHMIDVQFFGMNPGLHHLTNVILHAIDAILLFLLLNAMTGALWRSSLVAALFALHPAHVESVAWVAERKDVISTLFFLLTLMTYVNYSHGNSEAGNTNSKGISEAKSRKNFASVVPPKGRAVFFYALTFFFFALGLMSKPMLVTLPFVMLLIDYWPLCRIQNRTFSSVKRLALEKVPFLCLTVASCVITYLAQETGGAVDTLQRVPFEARLTNAAIAYFDYLRELVWPSHLAILYLRPDHWPLFTMVLAVALILALTLSVIFASRGRPWLAIGWFWFLGTLVPVIGLVQVGNQYMADRYTYIPYIGCFIALVWGGWELMKSARVAKVAITSVAAAFLGVATLMTHRQLQYWKNTETLFGHCLDVSPNNYSAHNVLGVAMARQNRVEDAKSHFKAALRIQPQYVDALQNLGVLLTEHGEVTEALKYLRQAVKIRPESTALFAKLGLVLDMKGLAENAIIYYRECLRFLPDQEDAGNNLAWLLATHPDAKIRDGVEAVRLAEHVCDVTGYQKVALIGTLAAAYAEAGRFDKAAETAEKAIQIATATGEIELAERNRQLLELYKSGKPYHEPRGASSQDSAGEEAKSSR
jgi:tetratricopeptide (TPR) repeat protein